MNEKPKRRKKSFVIPALKTMVIGQYFSATTLPSAVTPRSSSVCALNSAFHSYNVDTAKPLSAHILATVLPASLRRRYSHMTPSTNKRLYCIYGITTSGKIACVFLHSLHFVRSTSTRRSHLLSSSHIISHLEYEPCGSWLPHTGQLAQAAPAILNAAAVRSNSVYSDGGVLESFIYLLSFLILLSI